MKKLILSILLIMFAIFLFACDAIIVIIGEEEGEEGEQSGNVNLEILVYGTDSFTFSDKKIEKKIEGLTLEINNIEFKQSSGSFVTVFSGSKSVNLIKASSDKPKSITKTKIAPGSYKEVRLILGGSNSIKADGSTESIKIPSGEESGIKIKNNFTIPSGKSSKLIIYLDVKSALKHNKGQGFMLKSISGSITVSS